MVAAKGRPMRQLVYQLLTKSLLMTHSKPI